MVALKRFSIQLSALQFGDAIISAGGKAIVCKTGTADLETLYDPVTELAISNPISLVRGKMDFCVPVDRNDVDLYIQSPTGHFLVEKNVKPSGPNEFIVNTRQTSGIIVFPFSYAAGAPASEINSGLIVPSNAFIQPNPFIKVTALDAGITLEVGTLSTDGGDADGFIDVISCANLGLVKASLANGAVTIGADLKVQDSANAGDTIPEQNINKAGKAITWTLLVGADTAKGFVYLPFNLAA